MCVCVCFGGFLVDILLWFGIWGCNEPTLKFLVECTKVNEEKESHVVAEMGV
jgi:hypothetical protein